MFDYIAFDCETTGTNVREDAIVEIAGVYFEKGKPGKRFSTLVNPGKSIPQDATRVHGITDEMVAGQPPVAQALESFARFCGDTILVAHNAPFDVKFMGAAMKAHKTATPTGLVLDTYSIAKQALAELFNHRLETLVKHFEISASDFHRAEQDAEYCGKVFLKLLAHMKSKGQKLSFQNVVNLSGGELRFPKFELETSQLGLL